jgi:hypothetical protein
VHDATVRSVELIRSKAESLKQRLPDAQQLEAALAKAMEAAGDTKAALAATMDGLTKKGDGAKVWVFDTSRRLWVEYAPSKKQVLDAGFTVFVYAPVVGGAAVVCTVAGGVGGPLVAAASGIICSTVAVQLASALTNYAYAQTFENEIDPVAFQVGQVLGATLGAAAGVRYAAGALLPSIMQRAHPANAATYDAYRRRADVLKDRWYRENQPSFDPQRKRGLAGGYDLDHRIPVKCAWVMGLPVDFLDVSMNYRLLPASQNRSRGAAFCSDLPDVFAPYRVQPAALQ